MLEPIEFLIVQDLQSALRQIATSRGYHYDVASMAVKLDPNHNVEQLIAPDGPRPYVILEVGREAWQYHPAMELRLTLPMTVHWVSDSTPTDYDSRMQTFFRGCADVERAITQDLSRGGRATDTRIVGRTFDTAVEGAQVWAMVDLSISLLRTYGQPDAN